MIIVMNPNAPQASIDRVVSEIEKMGSAAHLSRGKFRTVIGAVGEEGTIDESHLRALDGVGERFRRQPDEKVETVLMQPERAAHALRPPSRARW